MLGRTLELWLGKVLALLSANVWVKVLALLALSAKVWVKVLASVSR